MSLYWKWHPISRQKYFPQLCEAWQVLEQQRAGHLIDKEEAQLSGKICRKWGRIRTFKNSAQAAESHPTQRFLFQQCLIAEAQWWLLYLFNPSSSLYIFITLFDSVKSKKRGNGKRQRECTHCRHVNVCVCVCGWAGLLMYKWFSSFC